VQLKGGVGEAGDRYERNADAIAAAIVRGRPTPALLGGDGSRGPRVQRRSNLGKFIDDQRALMARGRGSLGRKCTTVGFEFEFATMDDGPFGGLSHVEIAESSKMPDPKVPFVLETDASDALELVSPPFWVPTFGDQILPEPDYVEGVIDLFKERLSTITAKRPTIVGLAREFQTQDKIDFRFKDVPLARHHLTPRTPEELDVRGRSVRARDVLSMKIKPIEKFGGAGIDAQVNIATDAFGNDLLNQAFIGDRFSGEQHINAFSQLERRLGNVLYAHAFKPNFGWGRTLGKFMRAYTATDAADDAIAEFRDDAKKRLQDRINPLSGDLDWAWGDTDSVSMALVELGNLPRASGALLAKLRSYTTTAFEVEQIRGAMTRLAEGTIAAVRRIERTIITNDTTGEATFGPGELAAKIVAVNRAVTAANARLDDLPVLGEDKPQLRTFINALARALSGQLAVASIDAVRQAQVRRHGDRRAKMGLDMPELSVHQMMSSRVKDVRGVWAKAPVLDIGLGILSFKEWEKVSSMVRSTSLRRAIAACVEDVALGYTADEVGEDLLPTKVRKTYTIRSTDVAPLVTGALDGIRNYIDEHHLVSHTWTRSGREHTVKGEDRRKLAIAPDERPDFMSHERGLVTPRQDTFVPHKYVQMPEVWGGKSRQFVVESRTDSVATLRRIKAWLESQDG
ncbi:MAG: hypothetical protein KC486_09890, partial [Myxococcales bacterium]|nr:hypothetical protein [Myxococcales bacterium]